MKALHFTGIREPLSFQDTDAPVPAEGQVLVRIEAAALNHRDLFITQGLYAGIRFPCILGSDGAGWHGDRAVIINPNIGWGDDERFPDPGYHILGMPSHGTFAEQVAVAADRLADKPAHLTFEQAAALPLAGLTAYRALFTKGGLQPGHRVLISGIGGGVALLACQMAVAAGAEVYVTSGSDDKIARAMALGAKGGANYRQPDWHKTLLGSVSGFDLVLDSAGGEGFGTLVKLCAAGARMVLYGGTQGAWQKVSPQIVFWKQISIFGTSMGTDGEFVDMVDFVGRHRIVPVVDSVFALSDGQAALDQMAAGTQFGKIVLR